jgi:trehalose-6-phosphatase
MEQFDGRKIVELRPDGAGRKGAAVGRFIDRAARRPGARRDRSDAEAFVVSARPEARTVADASPSASPAETPPESGSRGHRGRRAARRGSALSGLARALEREG